MIELKINNHFDLRHYLVKQFVGTTNIRSSIVLRIDISLIFNIFVTTFYIVVAQLTLLIMELEFKGEIDRFNGVTVNSQKEPCELNIFIERLHVSIKKWGEDNRRCIWFEVNIKDASWVPLLAKEGFVFYHTRGDFLTMYKWLPINQVPNLPPACHTNIGVGGMVFNDKGQILVVSEKYIDFPHWKLPGGYVERGEDIKNAAIREVKEETDVDATFDSMVTLRHTHNAMFGNSDIYIVVKLKATSDEIEKSELEIKECKWMDVAEYLEHPHVHNFNRFLVQQAFDLQNRKIKLDLQKSTLKISSWTRDMTSLVIEDL